MLYALSGAVQFVAGIYFMLDLPIFHLGSNIWTGAWNLFSGITCILICSTGELSVLKAQGLLLLSVVVTIVNLVNLVILEVGEWRGFLSDEDRKFIEQNGFENLMYKAYLCTTVSTVVTMIVSFLGSQHTFCYLQLQSEKAKGQQSLSKNFDESDSIKDLVKMHEDELNLKTPACPQPHPSWVYRHNYAQFQTSGNHVPGPARPHERVNPVKRSLSLLKSGVNNSKVVTDRLDLLSKTFGANATLRKGVATISESVDGKHAVIRRHQSMYIHPRTTEPVPLAPYKLRDVAGGQSEVRPIVTLKRSHTTVGNSNATAPVHGYNRTFKTNSRAGRSRYDNNNNNLFAGNNLHHRSRGETNRKRRKSLSPSAYINHADRQGQHFEFEEICEFQVNIFELFIFCGKRRSCYILLLL